MKLLQLLLVAAVWPLISSAQPAFEKSLSKVPKVYHNDIQEMGFQTMNFETVLEHNEIYYKQYSKPASAYTQVIQSGSFVRFSFGGHELGVLMEHIESADNGYDISYLLGYEGALKMYLRLIYTPGNNDVYDVKATFTNIETGEKVQDAFKEKYFSDDEYIDKMIVKLAAKGWFGYALKPSSGLFYKKISDDEANKQVKSLLKLGQSAFGDYFLFEYNGALKGVVSWVYKDDDYEYRVADLKGKNLIQPVTFVKDLEELSFKTTADNKTHKVPLPSEVKGFYAGVIMSYLEKNGYLK